MLKAFLANSLGGEKTEGTAFKDRGVLFGFVIVAIFEVSEDNNARFRTVRFAVFVAFDDKDTHGRESVADFVGSFESKVVLFGYFLIDVTFLEPPFLLVVGVEPDWLVRIGREEGFQERRRTGVGEMFGRKEVC